jgi:hypothetical protein
MGPVGCMVFRRLVYCLDCSVSVCEASDYTRPCSLCKSHNDIFVTHEGGGRSCAMVSPDLTSAT